MSSVRSGSPVEQQRRSHPSIQFSRSNVETGTSRPSPFRCAHFSPIHRLTSAVGGTSRRRAARRSRPTRSHELTGRRDPLTSTEGDGDCFGVGVPERALRGGQRGPSCPPPRRRCPDPPAVLDELRLPRRRQVGRTPLLRVPRARSVRGEELRSESSRPTEVDRHRRSGRESERNPERPRCGPAIPAHRAGRLRRRSAAPSRCRPARRTPGPDRDIRILFGFEPLNDHGGLRPERNRCSSLDAVVHDRRGAADAFRRELRDGDLMAGNSFDHGTGEPAESTESPALSEVTGNEERRSVARPAAIAASSALVMWACTMSTLPTRQS